MLKMFRFLKEKIMIFYLTLLTVLYASVPLAYAEDFGIDVKEATSIPDLIMNLTRDLGMPIGGAILFLSVLFLGIKTMLAAFNMRQRESVMSAFGYVALGGCILGGCLFLAGAFLGIGQQLGQ